MAGARASIPLSRLRRLPVGAEILNEGGVHFRVWAPERQTVTVVFEDSARPLELQPEGDGYFAGVSWQAEAGMLYRFRLDSEERLFPDPASRFQPQGPHGPSEVINPRTFQWTDRDWEGIRLPGQVLYEMHVGTFTPEGTWASAAEQLPELARLGVTALEVMPVAEFNGRFGWGYDGVDLFAPARLYGRPDDFRRFVDAAHGAGLGVILDVVYNHLGPDGNYLKNFSKDYFSVRYDTDWGEAINFDGPNSKPVRDFVLANTGYWIEEFHLDGLRLDATQNIYDRSRVHILLEISRRARAAAGRRSILLVAENEDQRARLLRPEEEGGFEMDAVWNDDFHHSAMVALIGRREAYYTDYLGTPQELISAAKWGYLYQGQWYAWQQQRRGTPTFGLAPASFINFIQNHDQVANSGRGLRVHSLTSAGRYRALTALLLLMPGTPLLFQGQEFCSSAPFLFFADFDGDLAGAVREGRAGFLGQFPGLATPAGQSCLADPCSKATFAACRLDFSERQRHAEAYALHRDLLRLRKEDPVIRRQGAGGFDGAVLSTQAFALRFFSPETGYAADRLLIVNLGRDLNLTPAPEPLLAPPAGMRWQILWSSEDPKYGGAGTAELDRDGPHLPPKAGKRNVRGASALLEEEEGENRENQAASPIPLIWSMGGWQIPGESSVLLFPAPRSRRTPPS